MRLSRFAFLVCLTGFASAGWGQSPNGQTPQSVATYANLPLQFEQNLGQTDASVQFLSRGQATQLFSRRMRRFSSSDLLRRRQQIRRGTLSTESIS